MKEKYIVKGCLFVLTFILISCGEDFLDVKSEKSIASPSRISDYQALMDNETVMNFFSPVSLNIVGGEEFYVTTDVWNALPVTNNRGQLKMAYIWDDQIYSGEDGEDWNRAYERILYANIVINGLPKLGSDNKEAYDKTMGMAYFFRAWNYYLLAQTFCLPYNGTEGGESLGLPLYTEPEVESKSVRGSLKETYALIVDDLRKAEPLLEGQYARKMSPSKKAVFALLAKLSMDMGRFEDGLEYVSRALDINDKLVDYNDFEANTTYPFPADYGVSNEEVIYYEWASNYTIMNKSRMNVSASLLELYGENDLRKTLFFTPGSANNTIFRGGYTGDNSFFVGLGTSELYLAKAECLARLGRISEAGECMLKLLQARYSNLAEIPATDIIGKLEYILDERRRELAFRGVHWQDMKRLGQVMVSREINGTVYELQQGSNRYAWPIPENVIKLSSMEQNPR